MTIRTSFEEKGLVSRRIKSFSLILLVWILAGMFIFLQESVTSYGTPERVVSFSNFMQFRMPGYLIWALLTPLVFYISKRFPITRGQIVKNVFASIGLSFVVFTVYALLEMIVYIVSLDYPSSPAGYPSFVLKTISNRIAFLSFVYWVVLAIGHIVKYRSQMEAQEMRTARLEKALLESRLQTLKMKLHPHFLFNSLNAVSSLAVEKDTEGVRELVSLIGDLLRGLLGTDPAQMITVNREMEVVETYIKIEKFRFRERLKIETRIDPETLEKELPAFLIQPLVENSIKHGLSKRNDPILIEIDVHQRGDKLIIGVMDDGPGLPDGWDTESDSGIGISSIQERLELLYKSSFAFRVANRNPLGVVSEITLPWEEGREV